jgi:predicted NAD/FAD-dependent oxidoreductase
MVKKNIAIIGAGISGLILAEELKSIANIKIFEKARGVGGRMSSRSFENFTFDFGAQFFTAKSLEFKNYIAPLIQQKIVEKWHANFVEIDGNKITYNRQWNLANEHYIASPKMNSLAKYLAKQLENSVEIILQKKISKIKKIKKIISLFDEEENLCGKFDLVILTIPSDQAIEILPKNFGFFEILKDKKMSPCFSVMLGLKSKPKLDWDCAYLKNSKLSWIAFESSKPSRSSSESLTLLSRNSWASENLERDLQEIKNELIAEFEYATNSKITDILHSDIHRWKYANIEKQKGEKFIYDEKNSIALASDYFIQGRIECAFQSAMALAFELKNKFKNDKENS